MLAAILKKNHEVGANEEMFAKTLSKYGNTIVWSAGILICRPYWSPFCENICKANTGQRGYCVLKTLQDEKPYTGMAESPPLLARELTTLPLAKAL